MKKIHYTDRYLLNPHHPVTVFVIGADGSKPKIFKYNQLLSHFHK